MLYYRQEKEYTNRQDDKMNAKLSVEVVRVNRDTVSIRITATLPDGRRQSKSVHKFWIGEYSSLKRNVESEIAGLSPKEALAWLREYCS